MWFLQDIIRYSIETDEIFTYVRCHDHSSIVNLLFTFNLSGKETENVKIESIWISPC